MKYLLIIFLLLSPSLSWSKDVNIEDLVKTDGLYYEKFTDEPFTGEVTGNQQGKISKGKREGEWLIYHSNGQLEEDVNFKDGKKEGEYLRYSKNGKLYHKGNYKNDKIEGEYLIYYPNGQLRSKCNWKDGNLEGEYLNYYQNGQLKRTEIYKDGELIKTIQP